jgi:hypothetical protein
MPKRKHSPKPKTAPIAQVVEPNAAGIDIGATEIFVAVPADRDAQPVRCFATFTCELEQIAAWLKECGIESVVMESTGVFWIPLFQILEDRGFRVWLVNARQVKNVPGRKSDVADCQWLQYLHTVGLLRASHRPPQAICAMRSIWRHRETLVRMASVHIQHMQKALDQMNIQLHHVISDITGVTGLAIVDAILAGERNPAKLAELRDPKVAASAETIAQSLVGDYRSEHLFTLRQSLQAYRQYQKWITDATSRSKSFSAYSAKPRRSHPRQALSSENRFDRENEARKTLAQIIGGIFVLAGLYSSTQTLTTAREGQITDRFTKAIDQLGSVDASGKPKLEIRLGGIYALERIARDSEKDHWPVMEVLTAYVRENSSVRSRPVTVKPHIGPIAVVQPALIMGEHPRADIQAILTVLGRREMTYERVGQVIDLIDVYLFSADLTGAYLQRAHLNRADLSGADLSRADLGGAYLSGAVLDGAYLSGAVLDGADLSKARDLSQQQINSAFGNKETKLPPNLKRPEHWNK